MFLNWSANEKSTFRGPAFFKVSLRKWNIQPLYNENYESVTIYACTEQKDGTVECTALE